MTQRPGLYIMEGKHGRGVYTSEDIEAGALIELCPVIVLNPKDTGQIHETHLHDYYFIWDIEQKSSAIALGYGSLYNHSSDPNAEYENDYDENVIRFTALKHIPAHHEILIHYNAGGSNEYGIWFDDSSE